MILKFQREVLDCPVFLTHQVSQALRQCWCDSWNAAAVVGDAQVLQLYAEALARELRGWVAKVVVQDFPPGETHKTRHTKAILEDQLFREGLNRQTCIVAMGGGISLDLAGYLASTYMRGIAHINIPTSLLAQVDAAIGGKVGVNTVHGKNLIGAIHQPRAIIVSSDYLKTLPLAEWSNGLAEMVKHAVIADATFFEWLEAHALDLRQPRAIDPYPLERCVAIKGAIVTRDEKEAGLRSVLNFGHTIGHALEKVSNHSLPHGQAVAIGMLVEGRIASLQTGFPDEILVRLRHLMNKLQMPLTCPQVPYEDLRPFLGLDKKRKAGGHRLALPSNLGQMAGQETGWTIAVPDEILEKAWEEEHILLAPHPPQSISTP